MGAIETRTFRSGNGVAIRLPRALGYDADVPMLIEKLGDQLLIRPAVDAAAEKRKVLALVGALQALPRFPRIDWAAVKRSTGQNDRGCERRHPDRHQRRDPSA